MRVRTDLQNLTPNQINFQEKIPRIANMFNMSRIMTKPAFCICKNKGADQLRGINHAADQGLWFHYIDKYTSSTSYIRNLKSLTIFCGRTAWFVSDLVGNHEDRFSCNAAHIKVPACRHSQTISLPDRHFLSYPI